MTLPGNIIPNNYRMESLRYAIPWFDTILKNKRDSFDSAPIKVFVMGENAWRDEVEWPLARTEYQSYYLNQTDRGGSLMSLPGLHSESAFVYDPLNPVPSNGGASIGPSAGMSEQSEELRSDVVRYHTPALEADMEITGPLKLILYVSTNAVNTDFTAKLVDVFPDGRSYNISDGIVRQNFTPGKPTKIEIELRPTSILISQGHQLRLDVSSSNYPRFDRNPNTGEFIPTATTTHTAQQTIYHGAAYPSELILPVIPRW
jgi:putative CocE/NonD family hydrolase